MAYQLRLYSDYICPYCYVMERANIPRLLATYDVEIEWCGFQLHPEIPAGGVDLNQLLGPGRAASMRRRVSGFAAELGVELAPPAHAPSTVVPLAVTEYARDHGVLDELRDRLMDAYWQRGEDIESAEVLGRVAGAVGLEPGAAVAAGSDPGYLARVADTRARGIDEMVTGVPTLMFDRYPVVGCQRWETFELVCDKLGVPRREVAA